MAQAERIDRYEIIRKLATGGMAELFLAKQTGMEGFEKAVVLKRILAHLGQDDEFVSMFLDEARIAAKLSHPNVVEIFDLGHADDSYYIAMEYVSGRNMAAILRKAKDSGIGLPIEHICKIVSGVCDGLFYAHTRKDYDGKPLNIIHRDISPQNILVSFGGNVKLVDFGIAKASTQIAQTRAGVLKGKYAYMSPEQVRGDKIDARSDIFAVGIVMYEFLTGQRPFERETSLKTLKAIVQEKPLNPRELNPEAPIEVVRILSKALEKNPDRRYPNAQEMQLALEDYLDRAPRKSNTVRISRYLYELFDDELNADGGTMIVKGIGELIMPTGAKSDIEDSDSEVDEIPEGTVRAALAEVEAAHDAEQNNSLVSIVTDEKHSFSEVDTAGMSVPDQNALMLDAPPTDAQAFDDVIDTGQSDTGQSDKGAAQSEPDLDSMDSVDDFDDEDDDDQDTVMQPSPVAPDEEGDGGSLQRRRDEQALGDVDDNEGTVSGRIRGPEQRNLDAPEADKGEPDAANFSPEIRTGQDSEPNAQDPLVVDDDFDDDELDGATIPAYDLAQYGLGDDGQILRESPAPETDKAAQVSPGPTSADNFGVDMTDGENQQTASLSPAQVRRILDRVESLRQQAAGGDDAKAKQAPVLAGPPTIDAIEAQKDLDLYDDGVDYSNDIGGSTRAQPPPEFAEFADSVASEGQSVTEDVAPGPVPTAPMLPVLNPPEPQVELAPPVAEPAPPLDVSQAESGGIRVTRRRASPEELRERQAINQGGGPISGPARPVNSGDGPSRTAQSPVLRVEPPMAQPASAAQFDSPADDEDAYDEGTGLSTANARLILLLAILVAVAAGLAVLYLMLFNNPSSVDPQNAGQGLGVVFFQSEPPGAKLILDLAPREAKTPTTIGGLEIGRQHIVVFELEGYQKAEQRFALTPQEKTKIIKQKLIKTGAKKKPSKKRKGRK